MHQIWREAGRRVCGLAVLCGWNNLSDSFLGCVPTRRCDPFLANTYSNFPLVDKCDTAIRDGIPLVTHSLTLLTRRPKHSPNSHPSSNPPSSVLVSHSSLFSSLPCTFSPSSLPSFPSPISTSTSSSVFLSSYHLHLHLHLSPPSFSQPILTG
ncbi:hypothetical protein HOY80DRAFT_569801 [Tuber brumale]|nr:hypothetical protein HOY80DRAFT_569801 [Tuber brumale]